jgi:hypothetical protein
VQRSRVVLRSTRNALARTCFSPPVSIPPTPGSHPQCAGSRAGKIASCDPFGCKRQRWKQQSAATRRHGHRTCATAHYRARRWPPESPRGRPAIGDVRDLHSGDRRLGGADYRHTRCALSAQGRGLAGAPRVPVAVAEQVSVVADRAVGSRLHRSRESGDRFAPIAAAR